MDDDFKKLKKDLKNIIESSKENNTKEGFLKKNKIILAGLVFAGSIILLLLLSGVPINPQILGQVALGLVASGAATYGAYKIYGKIGNSNKTSHSKILKQIDKAQKEVIKQKLDLANIKELNEIQKELSMNNNNYIETLATKLGKNIKNNPSEAELAKLSNIVIKNYEGSDLDSDTKKEDLKKVLKAGLGLGDDDKLIKNGESDYIDYVGRIKILRELSNIIEYDFEKKYPKFKIDVAENKLTELQHLVDKEKTRSTKDKAKSAGSRVGA
ncbi:hypothetical protein LBMAG18_06800 [Alphaproteobacteria bacterium]|nr:hypothetical protein LBMAG18_06800 [Alphaproteobacteria bacterium]